MLTRPRSACRRCRVVNSCTPSVTSGASARSATAILLAALRATSRTTSTAWASVRCRRTSATTASGIAVRRPDHRVDQGERGLGGVRQVARRVVVDGLELGVARTLGDRLLGASRRAEPAVVLPGAAQAHQLGQRRVETAEARHRGHEGLDGCPDAGHRVAARGASGHSEGPNSASSADRTRGARSPIQTIWTTSSWRVPVASARSSRMPSSMTDTSARNCSAKRAHRRGLEHLVVHAGRADGSELRERLVDARSDRLQR